MNYADLASQHFWSMYNLNKEKSPWLDSHVQHVQEIATTILKSRTRANADVVLTVVWLHDIGKLIGGTEPDHAVIAETEARRFLSKLGANRDTIDQVAHCVRSHRNRDVKPQTVEAKILVASDSISHLLSYRYAELAERGNSEEALTRLQKDYADASLLEESKTQYYGIYCKWRDLLEEWAKVQKLTHL